MKLTSLLLILAFGIAQAASHLVLAAEPGDQTQFNGQTLSQWLKRLDEGRFEESRGYWAGQPDAAFEALQQFGDSAVPQLVDALANDSYVVRYNAAAALERIGIEAKAAVPALRERLTDRHPQVRCMAAGALGAIGADAADAIPDLDRLLDDMELHVVGPHGFWRVSDYARDALVAIGPKAVAAFQKKLKSEDSGVRFQAVTALGYFPAEAESVVPSLIQALDDQEPFVRATAAKSLGQLGNSAKGATGALANHVTDDGEYAVGLYHVAHVGMEAVNALRAIGPNPEDVPQLVQILTMELQAAHHEPDVSRPYRRTAMCASIIDMLGSVPKVHASTAPVLFVALDNADLRIPAAMSLIRLGVKHPRARIVLLSCLQDERLKDGSPLDRVRILVQAICLIRTLQWDDQQTIHLLNAALNEKDANVRVAASGALLRIVGDERSQHEFCKNVESDDFDIHYMPDFEPEIWKEFLAMLSQDQHAVELSLPVVLRRLTLKGLTGTGDCEPELAVLAMLKSDAVSSVPDLTKQLESAPEVGRRVVAAVALGLVGHKNRHAASAALFALGDSNAGVRAAAAESLGQIGIADGVVIEKLKEASNDEYTPVRQNARNAINLLAAERNRP